VIIARESFNGSRARVVARFRNVHCDAVVTNSGLQINVTSSSSRQKEIGRFHKREDVTMVGLPSSPVRFAGLFVIVGAALDI
jgi:hypothetical protein